ncbi:hypothetical protein LWF01_07750 [Saxibacter everestensis]|uniref:Uncharacterized protein n=1 Tax=Saxibacter everestensis TaxID=2909229 RepID=A0ABY8QXV5_9MICO|nr:hypothetical protein LWF01_07750 [Brevibacteriaceae bacterium ZFBP1038]
MNEHEMTNEDHRNDAPSVTPRQAQHGAGWLASTALLASGASMLVFGFWARHSPGSFADLGGHAGDIFGLGAVSPLAGTAGTAVTWRISRRPYTEGVKQ